MNVAQARIVSARIGSALAPFSVQPQKDLPNQGHSAFFFEKCTISAEFQTINHPFAPM
jgi:hypothetical protein